MANYNWKIILSDTESIAIERALWLLINQDIPGKDSSLVAAAHAVLGKLGKDPVIVSGNR